MEREFAELDRFIGVASREAEALGFHWWSVYITKDANDNLCLAMSVMVGTNDGKSVRAIPAFCFGENAFVFIRQRLRSVKEMMDEEIKTAGLEALPSPRGPMRLAWDDSLKFAPEFFTEERHVSPEMAKELRDAFLEATEEKGKP